MASISSRPAVGLRRSLPDLRAHRSLTQAQVAQTLNLTQSDVSRLERRSDVLVSTLRRFVQATGGQLELVVQYPDAESVRIDLGQIE